MSKRISQLSVDITPAVGDYLPIVQASSVSTFRVTLQKILDLFLATAPSLQEAWHEIGATGEPAFQNGWVNYSSGYATLAFMKDSLGFVTVKGFIKSGTITAGTTIFTLPAGYRPAKNMYYVTSMPASFGQLQMTSAGELQAATAINSTWTAIPYIRFKAEQ